MMGSVYWFCLGLGFTFTVASALLSGVMGHHGGDAGGGDVGGHDLAGGHDMSGGHDLAAGHDGDLGAQNVSMHLPILSPTVISAVLATFGGFGLIFRELLGDLVWLHAPLALITSLFAGFGLALAMFKITTRFSSSRVARLSDALGSLAEVAGTIPKDGVGEIAYVSGGTRQTLSARSADGKEHKQGASVKVFKVTDGEAWVGEVPLGGMAAVSSPVTELPPSRGEPVREKKD